MPQLRKNKTERSKLKKLFKQIGTAKRKRGAGKNCVTVLFEYNDLKFYGSVSNLAYFFLSLAHYSEGCTVGNITQVTISDGSFPFGYDQTQFDLCLDIPVLKGNLYSICENVDDNDFQEIILKKLNQVKLKLAKINK